MRLGKPCSVSASGHLARELCSDPTIPPYEAAQVEGHSEKVSFIWSVADLLRGFAKPAPGQGRPRHASDAAEPYRRAEFPQRLQVHFRLVKMSRTLSENPAMLDEASDHPRHSIRSGWHAVSCRGISAGTAVGAPPATPRLPHDVFPNLAVRARRSWQRRPGWPGCAFGASWDHRALSSRWPALRLWHPSYDGTRAWKSAWRCALLLWWGWLRWCGLSSHCLRWRWWRVGDGPLRFLPHVSRSKRLTGHSIARTIVPATSAASHRPCRPSLERIKATFSRTTEVDPVSWTPDRLRSRSPRWPRQDCPMHLSSAAKW